MKKLLFLAILLTIPGLIWAQDRPVSQGVTRIGSASTAYAAVALGSGIWDLAFSNRDTDTDTLKIVFNKADTSSASTVGSGRILFVFAGEVHNISKIAIDTLWIKSSGTTAYSITGVRR